jgi:alpha-2-macroglobulin
MKIVFSKFKLKNVLLAVGLSALVGLSAILSSKYDVQQVVGTDTAPRTAQIKKTFPLKVRAEQGDTEAQLELGNRYFVGQGVPKNYSTAASWFRRAAENGNSKAQSVLGRMLAQGKGVKQNPDEAARWLLRAAEQGSSAAQVYLAILNINGVGIPQNFSEALKWYGKAMEQRNSNARSIIRIQEGIEASTTAEGDAGSACITFDPPLKISRRTRYSDYVAVKPALKDLVTSVRKGKLCIDGLSFGEEYKVSLLPGLPGGDHSNTIIKNELSVFIPNRKQMVSFRERGYILPRYGAQVIPLETVNTRTARVRVIRIVERNLVSKIKSGFLGSLDRWDVRQIVENDGYLVFDGMVKTPSKKNKSVTSGLKIEELVGRKLGAGIYIVVAGRPSENPSKWHPETTQWFVVSDIGTSLFRGPDGLHVLTRSLKGAVPLPGVTVTLVAKNNRELARSVSDARGYTHFAGPLLNGNGGDEAIMVRTESADGSFSFVSLKQAAFDLRDRGVAGRSTPGPVDVYLFTERGIYRPGEVVQLTAIVRDDKGNALKGNVPLSLRLIRPDGVEVDRRVLKDAGSSSYLANMTIDPGARMGEWNARLYLDPEGTPIGVVSFQIADFVPPKIEVRLKGVVKSEMLGAKISLDVSADYFYGAPAAGLKVKASARIRAQRSPYIDWKGFNFGLEEEAFDPVTVNIEDVRLDDAGRGSLSASLEDFPDVTVPLQLDVSARVFELGGRARAKRSSLLLNNLEKAIGIRPLFDKGRVADGAKASFEIVSLDRNGKSVKTEKLEYTLFKEHRNYTWFRSSGSWDYEVIIRDEELGTGTLNVGQGSLGKIAVDVKWGAYRIEVRDQKTSAASSYKFYAGWGGYASGPDRPDSLQVEFDRKTYSAGETATAFVTPPFPGKLVLVVAGKKLEIIPAGDITMDGKSVRIPIKNGWAKEPGVYVMPIVFRPGDMAREQQAGRAIGIEWMKMDVSDQKLDVALKVPEQVRPGQKLTVDVEINSRNTETYISLVAVDEGVLSLTSYKTPDPFSYFFSQRLLAYEVLDTYGYLINPYGTERSVIRSGGDEATSRLDQGLSTRSSKVVSLFSGISRVNADGKARISFEVPQFSGRLRIMAVAWNGKQVGHAESKVNVRDPVVADLILPRFLAPGDRALATATFNNVSGGAGTYEVAFTSKGPLDFDGKTSWNFKLDVGKSFKIEVPITGSGVGVAGVSMQLTGPGEYRVTKNWDLTVRPIQPFTAEKTFVRLRKGDGRKLTAELLKPYLKGTGSVTLSVGSIPSFGVQSLVDDLRVYPYRCLEQTTSRAMAFLFGTGRYPSKGSAGAFPDDLKGEINAAISRLATLQRRDGSFGLWSSSGPREQWLSAYATDFLVRANYTGFHVPEGLRRNSLAWLQNNVQEGHFRDSERISSVAYSHYVLTRVNKGNLSKLRHFFDNYKNRFPSTVEAAFVASALASYGDKRRSKMAGRTILEWVPRATKQPSPQYDYYSSPVRQVAAVLHIAAEADMRDAKFDALAIVLAKQLTFKKRYSTQEAAWISMAAQSIERWTKNYKVEANGQLWEGPLPTRVRLGVEKLKRGFSVTNVGQDDATYEVVARGIKGKILPPISSGFSIKRELFGEGGKIVSLDDVKQGDAILVRLSGRVALSSEQRGLDTQAMIVDLLPAGLEIESVDVSGPIPGIPEDMSWEESKKLFVKGRDDRYVAALMLSGGDEFHLQYLARAVTKGNFAFPAPYVENMYRPDHFARGKVSSLSVRN